MGMPARDYGRVRQLGLPATRHSQTAHDALGLGSAVSATRIRDDDAALPYPHLHLCARDAHSPRDRREAQRRASECPRVRVVPPGGRGPQPARRDRSDRTILDRAVRSGEFVSGAGVPAPGSAGSLQRAGRRTGRVGRATYCLPWRTRRT
ncbi:hypothetical protein BC834DRAFT_892287 [Gloeopeniophorella convolvens]|nr:hypothetical protein BC834DRAFT_892287 [Gloeopeniophorella convolvens]